MQSVTDRQTDGQTDGQQDYANSRSYCVAVRSAKNIERYRIAVNETPSQSYRVSLAIDPLWDNRVLTATRHK